jgi:hypothetical protein
MSVPFGESIYQIRKKIESEPTPGRKLRKCLLQLREKEAALRECKFHQDRLLIDREEVVRELKWAQGSNKKRLGIDLAEIDYKLDSEAKLIEDAIIEVATYRDIMKGLPQDMTREEFEAEEPQYWKQRLLSDARHEALSTGTVGVGTLQALAKYGVTAERSGHQILFMEERNAISDGNTKRSGDEKDIAEGVVEGAEDSL